MTDIAAALKAEITRLAKKVVRQENASLQSASATYRRHIAALKRQVAALERELSAVRRQLPAPRQRAPDPEDGANLRFVAKGFRTLRARLGLTAEEMARLLDVSDQSVFNWEHERAKPRRAQMLKIAELRGLGKREVRARLEALAASEG